MTQLVVWEKMKAAIQEARSIDEVKAIRDKAEAMRLYAKQARESLEVQNSIAEIKIRAERRAGELLKDMADSGERMSQTTGQVLHDETPKLTLDEIGISRTQSHRWQTIASLPEERFESHIATVLDKNEELTSVGMYLAAKGVPKALQQSENNEWYTPAPYIEAARRVMGSVDLDPASNALANEIVQAARFYTIQDNGLSCVWHGNVWLNPPYGRDEGESNQGIWSTYLLQQFQNKTVSQAILLVNAVTDRQWFQPLWDYLICFTHHRIRFYNELREFGQPTHGNALVYLGDNQSGFTREFSAFGVIAKRIND